MKNKYKHFCVSTLLILLVSNSSCAETKYIQNINISKSVENIKNKSKVIFEIDNKSKKFTPKNTVYDINNYNKMSFATNEGDVSSYKILNNRYLVLSNYYASGGSGSVDNIYLIDLKTQKVWHTATSQTIAGDQSYFDLSENNDYVVFFDSGFYSDIVIMKINENEPKIIKTISKEFLKKSIKENDDIYLSNVYFDDNTLKIATSSDNENYKTIFYDIKSDKVIKINNKIDKIDLRKSSFEDYNENKKYISDNGFFEIKTITKNNQNFIQIFNINQNKLLYEKQIKTDISTLNPVWINNDLYINIEDKLKNIKIDDLGKITSRNIYTESYNLNKNNVSTNETYICIVNDNFINIFEVKSGNKVFSYNIFSSNHYKWLSDNKLVFFDKKRQMHLINLNNNIQNIVFNKLPLLNPKDNNDFYATYTNSNLYVVIQNNLFQINTDTFNISKLTNIKDNNLEDKTDYKYDETPISSLYSNNGYIFYSVKLNSYPISKVYMIN